MKKLFAIVCALVLALSLSASALAADITTIEEGKFIYSTSPDFPPFEYTDDDDNIIGIEPEIIDLICEAIGLTAEPYAVDFDSALEAPQQGKSDAVVSGVTVREDRKLVFDFTDTYISIVQAIVFKEGADISMDNLGDQIIGVQRGTTGQIYTEEDYGEDHVVGYDTYSLVFQALLNGQIDCIVMDDAVAKAYVDKNPGLTMVQTTYEPEDFAFGIAKGNTALVDAFNEQLSILKENGTLQAIIDKYMAE
ncbi:MAG: transporter substrate-binding domain-containing protein [Clostridia bacterium]|nr:transporter substrate-binding domain-containing protein [Clostridia bacterium]